MAGTRLLIQGVFAVEFFVVLVIAVYGGILCDPSDRLSIVVFQQTGRGPLSKLLQSSAVLNGQKTTELSFPGEYLSPRVLCQESQTTFWKDIVQKAKLPSDKVTVQGDESTGLLSKYCENPHLLLSDAGDAPELRTAAPDLVVCDFWVPRQRARLVAVGGTLVLYTRSISKRLQDMKAIFPKPKAKFDCLHPDARVNLVLAVDGQQIDANWKEWVTIIQDRLASDQSSWRSLVRARHNPIHFELKVVHGTSAIQSTVRNNQTYHHLASTSFDDVFGKPSGANNHLDIVLYLPPIPVVFSDSSAVDTTNRMMMQGTRLVQIISLPTESDAVGPTKEQAVYKALGYATDFVTRQCTGVPMNEDLVDEESLDGSLPRLCAKLWWQRTLGAQYQKAVRMAQRHAQLWKDMSYRSPLTADLVKEFQVGVVDPLELIPELLANQSLAEALERLEHSLDLLQDWETDDTFMPPLDFPPEQYAAIFAPLVVPLLLPLVVGLVREYKRYRELETKKVEGKQKTD